HHETRDVRRRQALHDPGRGCDLLGRDLSHFGHGVHHDAELSALPLENHAAGLLAVRGRNAEPLAQVHQRDGGPLVLEHALQKIGGLGQRRRCLVAKDTLHLEDVEGEVLPGQLEGDELYVVARGHPMRSPSASRSRIGTRAPRRRATPEAHGSDSPRGTGSAASRTTSSASSTSKATRRAPSPAPISTSTAVRPRSGGGVRSLIKAPRCTTGTRRPRTGVRPRIAGSGRGTSSTSARSPTSSTRASGNPYARPSTRTRRYPRLIAPLPARPAPRRSARRSRRVET